MRQQTPLILMVACIGLLLLCYQPLSGQNTFRKYDHWCYRIVTSYVPTNHCVTDRIYDITVLDADKRNAILACSLVHADDSVETLRARYHFVSSDSATWTTWDTDGMAIMAMLYQPILLKVTDHETLTVLGVGAVIDSADRHWQLPAALVKDLRWRIPTSLHMDIDRIFTRQPKKLKPGRRGRTLLGSYRIEAVIPETVTMYSRLIANGDSVQIRESVEYTLLRENSMVDRMADTIIVMDRHRKTGFSAMEVINIQLLPVDTVLPATDTALLRQRILKSPWHRHALLYHYPTKMLTHHAGKIVALQAIKPDDIILQVCKVKNIKLSQQQPERNTTDKTAHEKTDLIVGCGVYVHHRLQSTGTTKRSRPHHQHISC
ncbi:hypothetical protein HHL17_00535 [Chitinophaga sp. G-6-1-13]|uniref:Uncharacterized protein n=1 Tax=Chitinophaga fulva TaxID=2728842 RepID=A0A848GII0_9BACT|nr:hypothetical protein [Chitinophaga fulva]NML35668.1 hypothetical protein [Chitinophaga fulva]